VGITNWAPGVFGNPHCAAVGFPICAGALAWARTDIHGAGRSRETTNRRAVCPDRIVAGNTHAWVATGVIIPLLYAPLRRVFFLPASASRPHKVPTVD